MLGWQIYLLLSRHRFACICFLRRCFPFAYPIDTFPLQALAQRPVPPSQAGQPLPEPASPYLDSPYPSTASFSSSTANPAAGYGAAPVAGSFGMTNQAAPFGADAMQPPFGMSNQASAQPQLSQPGRIQFGHKAGQAASNLFGSSSSQAHGKPAQMAATQPNPFGQGSSQSGRLQFGSKAGQPAAPQFGPASSRQGAAPPPLGSQGKPVKPFNSTDDPFGRQKSGQPDLSHQQSASSSAHNPFAQQQRQPAAIGFSSQPFGQQQQQVPATPAAFGASGGPKPGQPQASHGTEFQTPAVQQRPAFAGGVAASLQTPSPGRLQQIACDQSCHALSC